MGQPMFAAPGTVCQYKSMKGKAYESVEVWEEAETHEKAKKMCDENEECAGYHLHGHVDNYYLFKHNNEIIDESQMPGEYLKDFTAYKKRLMTCSTPGADSEEDFDAEAEDPNTEEL